MIKINLQAVEGRKEPSFSHLFEFEQFELQLDVRVRVVCVWPTFVHHSEVFYSEKGESKCI